MKGDGADGGAAARARGAGAEAPGVLPGAAEAGGGGRGSGTAALFLYAPFLSHAIWYIYSTQNKEVQYDLLQDKMQIHGYRRNG